MIFFFTFVNKKKVLGEKKFFKWKIRHLGREYEKIVHSVWGLEFRCGLVIAGLVYVMRHKFVAGYVSNNIRRQISDSYRDRLSLVSLMGTGHV